MCVDLLPMNILRNYALLVKSLYTLLKVEISKEELNQCDLDLRHFVRGYIQVLYSASGTQVLLLSIQLSLWRAILVSLKI